MALSIPATIFRVGGGSFEDLPELILDQTFDQVPKISLINVKRNPMTLPITQCHSSVLAMPTLAEGTPEVVPPRRGHEDDARGAHAFAREDGRGPPDLR